MLAVWLAGCVVGSTDGTWSFDGASAVSVALGNGDVEVRGSPDALTVVAYDGGGIGRAAVPDVFSDRDDHVHVEARGQLGGGDVRIELADGTPIDVLLDRGDVDVALSEPASVDVCVGAGSVALALPAGEYDLDLDLAVGSVDTAFLDVDGAPFVVSVCLGAGDVSLRVFDPAVDGLAD